MTPELKPCQKPIVTIARWHIPLDAMEKELSLVFFGHAGEKVTLTDLDSLGAFVSLMRLHRTSSIQRKSIDYTI